MILRRAYPISGDDFEIGSVHKEHFQLPALSNSNYVISDDSTSFRSDIKLLGYIIVSCNKWSSSGTEIGLMRFGI